MRHSLPPVLAGSGSSGIISARPPCGVRHPGKQANSAKRLGGSKAMRPSINDGLITDTAFYRFMASATASQTKSMLSGVRPATLIRPEPTM